MKNSHKRLLIIPVMLTAFLITACGSKPSSAASETMAYAETAAAGAMAMENDQSYSENAMSPQAPMDAPASETGQLTSQTDTSSTLPASRKLIRTVNLIAETDEFEKLVTSVQAKITDLGGYIEQSNISGSSMNYLNEPVPRYASLIARIPSVSMSGFVQTVESGCNVTNKYESTSDVTLQYSDMESRKKSLAVEQDRLWALLEKADSLDAIIALEQRLSDIRYQLESMESQLRLYDNQVDYSTVNLEISEVTDFTPTAPVTTSAQIQKGFSSNVNLLRNFMTSLFILLVTTLPMWLPLAVITVIVLIVLRRKSKKEQKEEAPKVQASPEEPKQP